MAEMTDKEWEDREVASAQVLWDNLNTEEEQKDIDLESLTRPDRGQRNFREPLWSEVIEGLWQGGTHDDDAWTQMKQPMITKKDFDTVVTMYAYANPTDWFVREIRYGVYDSNMKDFDVEELFDVVKLAHSDWQKGKKVLVRCQAGWNRSGLITALVLMREGMPAQRAINLIREKRSSWALCNSTFVSWLLAEDPESWKGDHHGTTRSSN